MRVLVTGAFGNIGLSTLDELLKKGHKIRAFDLKTKRNLKFSKKIKGKIEIIWGDLRSIKEIEKAVKNQQLVIHLAGIIPPLADFNPQLAETVNVRGTANLIETMEKQSKKPKLIFSSSVTVYGDRRHQPLIKANEPPHPNLDDGYAKQKLDAENLIRKSKLKWSIFRLTYIVSKDKLQMDPLLFRMPLDTPLEICDQKDVGLALANAVESHEIWKKIILIAGGPKCRIIYKNYLDRMTEIFGLGKNFLPPEAFSKSDFHCGFMDTRKSQEYLHYQRYTLDDYFKEVWKKFSLKRFFVRPFKRIIRHYLLKKSIYYQAFKK